MELVYEECIHLLGNFCFTRRRKRRISGYIFVLSQLLLFSDKPLIRITSDVNTCQPHATSDTCYITMGHNVTLVCSAESNPLPVSFEWFNKTMATSEKLNIISANASRHEGLYNCTVQTKSDDYDKRLPLSASYVFTIIVQGSSL